MNSPEVRALATHDRMVLAAGRTRMAQTLTVAGVTFRVWPGHFHQAHQINGHASSQSHWLHRLEQAYSMTTNPPRKE